MLSAAKHLVAQEKRPFAAAQGDKVELSRLANAAVRESIVTLSEAKHLGPGDETLRFAQGDTWGSMTGLSR